MRRLRLVAATALALVAAPALLPSSASATGLPSDWERGFNYTSWWHDRYATAAAEDSMVKMTSTGANSIAVIANWYQASPTATWIAPDPNRSPSDAAITAAVQRAKARGLKVMLRVWAESASGGWRGSFAPSSVSAWFDSYRRMSAHYAGLARSLGVGAIDIGSEYHTLERYEQEWRSVVSTVRAGFNGRLSYGANWPDHANLQWWDAVDAIGIDAYFPLSTGDTPGVATIADRWKSFADQWGGYHRYVDEIAATQARFRKPVIFTEVGYPSNTNPLQAPWSTGGTYSGAEQQRALEAAFTAFAGQPWFKGVYVWHWNWDPMAGGVGNTDHTPQNKPAEDTIRAWYSGPSTPTPMPEPTPTSTPTPMPEPTPTSEPTPTAEPTATQPAVTTTTTTVTKRRRRKSRSSIARVRPRPVTVIRGRVTGARGGAILIRARVRRPYTTGWTRFLTKRVNLSASGRFRAVVKPPRGLIALDAQFLGTRTARGSHAPKLVFRITRRGALVRL